MLAGVALLGGACQKPSPAHPGVVATVGDAAITKDSFLAEIERRAKNGQSVGTAVEREAVLEDMIRLETFFAKAKAAGFDRDSELTQQFKRMIAAKFEEDQRRREPAPRQPEPGEVMLFYNSHKDQFTSPEKVRVAVIYLRVPFKAETERIVQAQQRAEELRRQAVDQASAAEHFGLLAQDNSDDQATRYRGGDCGFITRDTAKVRWDQDVLHAAFALKQRGEISSVVRAGNGFYLLKLIERKPAETAPLEQVHERIERQMLTAETKRAREKFEAAQRRGMKVEINDALLRSIEAPAVIASKENAAPPAMPTP